MMHSRGLWSKGVRRGGGEGGGVRMGGFNPRAVIYTLMNG